MNRKVTTETEMLRKARLRKGLSQQQVATLAGVHIRQYQRIEYGERPMGSINMRFGRRSYPGLISGLRPDRRCWAFKSMAIYHVPLT